MTTNNLPTFNGMNDIQEAARRALLQCAADEKRGASAIWPIVTWCAALAAQDMAAGLFQSGDWMQDKEAPSYKAWIKRVVGQSGADAALEKNARDADKNERRASIARMERGARLFLAFSVLADKHSIGADYDKRRVPAAWFVDADKYEILAMGKDQRPQMVPFVSRNEKHTALVYEIAEAAACTISIKPSETECVTIATGGRNKRQGNNPGDDAKATDVSDASVKASADVLASRLARDGGAVTGEAADALESVYAALVANDSTWSLLVALRQKHERDAAATIAVANGEPA